MFIVLLVTRLPNLIDDLTPGIQVIMPGTHEIQLSEAGNYSIFYEYRSVIDNRVFASGPSFSGMSVELESKEGLAAVDLSRPTGSTTYETGGRAGVSILKFKIDKPGSYVVAGQYGQGSSGPDVVFAIGKFSILGLLALIAAVLGSFFGGIAIGAVIIIVTISKRRKPKPTIARISGFNHQRD